MGFLMKSGETLKWYFSRKMTLQRNHIPIQLPLSAKKVYAGPPPGRPVICGGRSLAEDTSASGDFFDSLVNFLVSSITSHTLHKGLASSQRQNSLSLYVLHAPDCSFTCGLSSRTDFLLPFPEWLLQGIQHSHGTKMSFSLLTALRSL